MIVNHYCVLCTAKVIEAQKYIQQRPLSCFITITLY